MKPRRVLWVAFSAILHVMIVILMLQAIITPRRMGPFGTRDAELKREQVLFVIPEEVLDNSPVIPEAPTTRPMPAAPGLTPRELPAITAPGAPPIDTAGRTAAADEPPATAGAGGGRLPSLRPSQIDPRLMLPDNPLPAAPRPTDAQAFASALDSAVRATKDSLSRLGRPGDWTVGEGKGKFGIDPQWIYVGPVKIPTAVLALVPLNVQANPNQRENARTLGAMASEVRERAYINGDAQEEIRRINARMQRERAIKKAAASGGTQTSRKDPPER